MLKYPKFDGYQKGLASMIYKFFDKKSKESGVNNEIKQNDRLAKESHKSIVKNLKEEKHIHHLKTIFGVLI